MVYADDNVQWDINELESSNIKAFSSTEKLLNALEKKIESVNGKSNVLIMSNGGFENLYQRLIERLP